MGKNKFELYKDLGEVGDTIVSFTIWYNHTITNWDTGEHTLLGYRVRIEWRTSVDSVATIDESLFPIDRQSITRLRLAIERFKARKHLYLEEVEKKLAAHSTTLYGELI